MAELRYHDQRAGLAGAVEELRLHGEFFRDGSEFLFQPGDTDTAFRQAMDPQEETAIDAVAELLAVQDVAVALEQKARHFRHDAAAVGTGNRQDKVGLGHAPPRDNGGGWRW